MTPVELGSRSIGPGHPTYVIAETSHLVNKDINLALKLVDAAAEAGADGVLFKCFQADSLAGNPRGPSLEELRNLELSLDDLCRLKSQCVERGITFLATASDRYSADELEGLGMPMFSITSAEVTHTPLLKHIAKKGKPTILSTSMSYLGEVDQAVGTMRRAGCHRLILLQSVSSFPCLPAEINLRSMETLSDALRVPVGLSDHCPGTEVALAAVALGARVIQKHLSLDGGVEEAALDPSSFGEMVSRIRIVEQALGDGIKKPSLSELQERDDARRSLALAGDLPAGETLSSRDLVCLRPAHGLQPSFINQLVGKRLRRDLKAGTFLAWGDIE